MKRKDSATNRRIATPTAAFAIASAAASGTSSSARSPSMATSAIQRSPAAGTTHHRPTSNPSSRTVGITRPVSPDGLRLGRSRACPRKWYADVRSFRTHRLHERSSRLSCRCRAPESRARRVSAADYAASSKLWTARTANSRSSGSPSPFRFVRRSIASPRCRFRAMSSPALPGGGRAGTLGQTTP
jgi:hypothetical protein